MRRLLGVVVCAAFLLSWLGLAAAGGSVSAGSAGASGPPQTQAPAQAREQEIRIAGQFGLVYAPLMIAQKNKIFEKYGLKPIWREYGSGAAVREALVSGEVDVGFMGIPPFLIGWDKGCPWKAAIGFCVVPVGLVTNNPSIKSLKDFRPTDKIAVPSPGSVQHILLAMQAEKELGSATAFEKNIVAMPHPDAAAALLSKKGIVAHFTTPPYMFEELNQPGMHLVVDDVACFGLPFSFNVGVATTRFHDGNPVAYACFVMAISEAMAWINVNKKEAAALLAPEFGLTPEKTYLYLTWPGMDYTTAPYGLMGFADFMREAGYIKNVPRSIDDIAWENLVAFIGDRAGGPSPIQQLQFRR
ncbi:MAG: ABC transporter substrate-binding protein [Firmicutes bacterium]|nr:ABC transporter substrate-binding protein [Bacillota bacterium]MDH7496317.1 ABC transporter substrate-binding protein [Bacillota bacterium]